MSQSKFIYFSKTIFLKQNLEELEVKKINVQTERSKLEGFNLEQKLFVAVVDGKVWTKI